MKRIFAFLAVLMAFGLFGTLARAADAVIGLSAGFDFRVDLTDADDRDRNDFESNAAPRFYFNNPELVVRGSRTTDLGLETGFVAEIRVLDSDGPGDNVLLSGADGETTLRTEEFYVTLGGGFGRFVMGHEDGAADRLAVGADFVSVGIADLSNTKFDSGDSMKVTYYAPALGPVSLGVSIVQPFRLRGADTLDDGQGGDADAQAMDPNPDAGEAGNREQEGGERVATDFTFEFGLKAEVSIVTFGLGFYSGERLNADEDQGGMTAGVALDFGPFDTSLSMSMPTNTEDTRQEIGLGFGWGNGPIGVSLTLVQYMSVDDADDEDGSAGIETDRDYVDGEPVAGTGELSDLSEEDSQADLAVDLNFTYAITDGVTAKARYTAFGDDEDEQEGGIMTVALGFSF